VLRGVGDSHLISVVFAPSLPLRADRLTGSANMLCACTLALYRELPLLKFLPRSVPSGS